MVVYKGVQTASDSLQTAYIVGDFKEIVVVKAGVNASWLQSGAYGH